MDEKKYAIGLSLNIDSVGWSVVTLDSDTERPVGLYDIGTRTFTRAEVPKTGKTLSEERRLFRSVRRVLRRKRRRKERIKNLIDSAGIMSRSELDIMLEQRPGFDAVGVRTAALDRLVTDEELARIMINLAQRRGYSSTSTAEDSDSDGKIIESVRANSVAMASGLYRTAGEMYLKDPRFGGTCRNSDNSYTAVIARSLVEDEARKIFRAQRSLGNAKATEVLEERYVDILMAQRSYDEGPADNGSIYAGNGYERLLGSCSIFPEEKRAVKNSWTNQYSTLLQKVNSLRLCTEDGDSIPLTIEQRSTLISLAMSQQTLTYKAIRKKLKIADELTFNSVSYKNETEETRDKTEGKTKFNYMAGYMELAKALKAGGRDISELTHQNIDDIAEIITFYKSDKNRQERLAAAGFDEGIIACVLPLKYSGSGAVSKKAALLITPYLEKGMTWSEAVAEAGLSMHGPACVKRSQYLKWNDADFTEVTNPRYIRTLSNAIKVINAIVRTQGCSPVYINFTVSRIFSQNLADRKESLKHRMDAQAERSALEARIRSEFGRETVTGKDIAKLRLYDEQNGIDIYTGKKLDIGKLFDDGYAAIDHIIPFSRSYNGSRNNTVLCRGYVNDEKASRTPVQYLGRDNAEFEARVEELVKDYAKRKNLLRKTFNEDTAKDMRRSRSIDGSFPAKFFAEYLSSHLKFAPSKYSREGRSSSALTVNNGGFESFTTYDAYPCTEAVSGSFVGYLTGRWGLTHCAWEGTSLEPAAESLVAVCSTLSMKKLIQKYCDYEENRARLEKEGKKDDGQDAVVDEETGEVVQMFPTPWYKFNADIKARLGDNPVQNEKALDLLYYREDNAPQIKKVFVSKAHNGKVGESLHDATIYGARHIDEGIVTRRVALKNLTVKEENGEYVIPNFYDKEGSARLDYEKIIERLKAYDGKPEKAFSEEAGPLIGVNGIPIKKVTLAETYTGSGQKIRGGIVSNGSMTRIDVYMSKSKKKDTVETRIVPVYKKDACSGKTPDRAVCAGGMANWEHVEESDFCFSLRRGDPVLIEYSKSPVKGTPALKGRRPDAELPAFNPALPMYFKAFNTCTERMDFVTHDGAYNVTVSSRNTVLKKYVVDVLGNLSPVKREKFPKGKTDKSGK